MIKYGLIVACGLLSSLTALESKTLIGIQTIATARGKAMVDSQGMTLYTFDEDKNGQSACGFFCTYVWPPLKVSASTQGLVHWSAIDRGLGSTQATYKGHPLYTYAKDSKPGDVNGDGVDGTWHIARP